MRPIVAAVDQYPANKMFLQTEYTAKSLKDVSKIINLTSDVVGNVIDKVINRLLPHYRHLRFRLFLLIFCFFPRF